MPYQLILCDLSVPVVEALRKAFDGESGVEVRQADITRLKCEAMATAGNSFGDMGGGVDKAIDDYFQGKAQNAVHERIRAEWYGELPVGSAVVVSPAARRPLLIYAPTMRVPGRLSNSINPYLAMRAILIEMLRRQLATVACMALGTGVGGVDPADAADQMHRAYRLIIGGEWQSIVHSLQAPYIMR